MFRSAILVTVLMVANPVEAQLVWFHAPSGTVTHEFRGSRSIRQLEGLYVELPGETVRVRIETVRVRAWDCYHDENAGGLTPVVTEQWNVARRLLVDRSSGTEVLIGASENEANSSISDRIRPVASLGPYLLVRRDYYYFAVCSAHGNWMRSWFWFDLRDGSQIDVLAPSAAIAQLPELEQDIRDALRDDVADANGDVAQADREARSADGAEVVGVEARLRSGRWRARVHVQVGVPYVWSEGATAYARDGQIDTNESLGPRLAPFERVPRYVREFLHARPRWVLGGVSVN